MEQSSLLKGHRSDFISLALLLFVALVFVPLGLLVVRREESSSQHQIEEFLDKVEADQLAHLKVLLALRPEVERVKSLLSDLHTQAASLESANEARNAVVANKNTDSKNDEAKKSLGPAAPLDPQLAVASKWEQRREAGGGEFQAATGAIPAPPQDLLEARVGPTLAREIVKVHATMNAALKKSLEGAGETVRAIEKVKLGRDKPFYVKWHSKDGLQSSERFDTETEAAIFFEKVGDFAKKLLMFDGTHWGCIKEFGGDNWLNLMEDSGNPQTGEHKPPLAHP